MHSGAGTLAGVGNRLAALNPPSSLAASWRTYVGDIRQEVTKISGMANAIPVGDGKSFRRDLRQAHLLAAVCVRSFMIMSFIVDCWIGKL